MSKKYNIITNVITNYSRDIVDVVVFLYLIPFIIQTLGRETFGLWSLIWAFVSMFALLDLGFGPSIVKYIGKARGEKDTQQEQKVIATLFWLYVVLGSILFLSIVACTLFFNSIFEIPQHQQEMARHVLLILGCRAALCMPLELFRGVLISYHQYRIANVYKVIGTIVYFFAVITLLSYIADLRMLAIANALLGILPLVAIFIHLKIFYQNVSIHPRNIDLSMVKEMSSFSMYFFIIQISTIIATRIDSLIIQKYLNLEMVALYSIAMRITDKAFRFCTQLAKTLTPVISELHGANEKQKMIAVWLRGTKFISAFSAPLLVGLFILSHATITSWAGQSFADSVTPCQILIVAVFVMIIHGNTNTILTICDQQKYFSKITIFGQLLNLVLSVMLIQTFGIIGVAVATLVSTVVVYAFVQRKACQIYEISILHFYQKTCLSTVFPSLVLVVFLCTLEFFLPARSLWTVAIYEGAAIIIYTLLFTRYSLDEDEKQFLKNKLRKRRKT